MITLLNTAGLFSRTRARNEILHELLEKALAAQNAGAAGVIFENSNSAAPDEVFPVVEPLINDEGAHVALGAVGGREGVRHDNKYYCGRRLGVDAIPGSDGQCGPSNGPQCASCARFQRTRQGKRSKPSVTIPVVMVSYNDAKRIKELLNLDPQSSGPIVEFTDEWKNKRRANGRLGLIDLSKTSYDDYRSNAHRYHRRDDFTTIDGKETLKRRLEMKPSFFSSTSQTASLEKQMKGQKLHKLCQLATPVLRRNCPGNHGLVCTQSEAICDSCNRDIKPDELKHSCQQCDYDLCRHARCGRVFSSNRVTVLGPHQVVHSRL